MPNDQLQFDPESKIDFLKSESTKMGSHLEGIDEGITQMQIQKAQIQALKDAVDAEVAALQANITPEFPAFAAQAAGEATNVIPFPTKEPEFTVAQTEG